MASSSAVRRFLAMMQAVVRSPAIARIPFFSLDFRVLGCYSWLMEMVAFNTHNFVKNLVAAGMPEPQAEVLVDWQARVVDERAASKDDLKRLEIRLRAELNVLRTDVEKLELSLRADMEKLELSLRADMEELGLSLRADIEKSEAGLRADMEKHVGDLRSDIEKAEASLRSDMGKMELRLTTRLGGMIVAAVAGFAVLVKLL